MIKNLFKLLKATALRFAFAPLLCMPITLVFAEINSIRPYNGPQLVEVFVSTQLPTLSPEAIIKESEIHYFKSPNGIVLYDSHKDCWQLYSHLTAHEDKGKLETIARGGDSIWVTLENALIRIRQDSTITDLPFYTDIIGFTSQYGYFAVLEPRRDRRHGNSEYDEDYWTTKDSKLRIKRLDLKSNEIKDIASFDRQDWGNLLSWAFQGKKFWFAFAYKTVSVNLQGEMSDLTLIPGFPERVTHFESIGKKLFCFADGAYEVSSFTSSHPKVNKVYHGNRYKKFDSTTLAENALYMLPSESPWSSTLLKYVFKPASEQRVKLPQTINPDGLTYFDSHLWMFSVNNQIVAKWDTKANNSTYYPIRDGVLGKIVAFVEDDKEIWFLSDIDGVFVYNKETKAWKLLPLARELSEYGSIRQITLNNEYAFLAKTDNYGMPVQYILINRENLKWNVVTGDQLRDRFYSNHSEVAVSMNPWAAIIFFLRLPMTGVDSDYERRIIHKNKYSLTSVFSRHGDIIYKLESATGKLEAFNLPVYIKYFGSSIVPHSIAGDDQVIWGGGRGHSSQGLYKFSLSGEQLEQNKEWHENLQDCWGLGENEDEIFIGINHQKKFLGVVNKSTGKLDLFGEEVGFTGTPYTIASNAQFDFFATDRGVIYFNRKEKMWGKILEVWTRLHQSGYGLYVEASGNKFYRVLDSEGITPNPNAVQ